MKRAIVMGTFDLTHYGHMRKFKLLKELGYETVAGVTSDEFAEDYKRKPILTQEERMENLQHCKWVDIVIPLNVMYDHRDEVLACEATHVVHSRDWNIHEYGKQTALTDEWFYETGVKRLILPYTNGISTSDILERVHAKKSA